MAPASSAVRMLESSAKVVRTTTLTVGQLGRQALRGGDAVDVGHAQVHQHHVGREAVCQLDRFVAVGGQADHLRGRVRRRARWPAPRARLVWSSATTIRDGSPRRCSRRVSLRGESLVVGHAEPDLPSRTVWSGLQRPADELGPLAQPLNPVAAPGVGQRHSGRLPSGQPVSVTVNTTSSGVELELHRRRGARGVLARIGQCLPGRCGAAPPTRSADVGLGVPVISRLRAPGRLHQLAQRVNEGRRVCPQRADGLPGLAQARRPPGRGHGPGARTARS